MKKQIFNPYLPSYEYIPDGEPYIFDDRLYIFGSHDRFDGTLYCENDYVCWSAPIDDISDWRYEGVIYEKRQHPYKIGTNCLYAPDVTKGPDGRFYLYYSVSGSSIISVAVCDTPSGKYEYYGDVVNKEGIIVGKNSGDFFQFDPSIFIDDNGRIFLYSGFCPKVEEDAMGRKYVGAHVCELELDMLTVKEGPEVLISRDRECPEGARFFEASSMRKINGIYYFVYSARVTGLHYYYSKYPNKEFIYGGKIHSTSDIGINGHSEEYPAYPVGNTHGGIVCIKGQYYIFNHRLTNNSSFSRQGVAEAIWFDSQGMIKQVEATSCGLNGGPLIGKGEYPAYIACNLIDKNNYSLMEQQKKTTLYITQEGEDREYEPGQYLKGMKNNCMVGYKYFSFTDCNRIILTVRGTANGQLKVLLQEDSECISELEVNMNTQTWTKISAAFAIQAGVYPIYFEFKGNGVFDILSFSFE